MLVTKVLRARARCLLRLRERPAPRGNRFLKKLDIHLAYRARAAGAGRRGRLFLPRFFFVFASVIETCLCVFLYPTSSIRSLLQLLVVLLHITHHQHCPTSSASRLAFFLPSSRLSASMADGTIESLRAGEAQAYWDHADRRRPYVKLYYRPNLGSNLFHFLRPLPRPRQRPRWVLPQRRTTRHALKEAQIRQQQGHVT